MKKTFWPALLMTLALSACSGQQKSDSGNSGTPAAGDASNATESIKLKLDGTPVTVAGIKFTPPASWNSLGAKGMRQAQYSIAPIEGETDTAMVVLFYFGPQGGGDVESNISRWIGQVKQADGSDSATKAKRTNFEVNGLPVHWMEVSGTYDPGMMMGGTDNSPKENYHMAATVVEGPEGNLFFRLTGPEKTALQVQPAFLAMMNNLEKGEATSNPQ